jgi:hypothetical protein
MRTTLLTNTSTTYAYLHSVQISVAPATLISPIGGGGAPIPLAISYLETFHTGCIGENLSKYRNLSMQNLVSKSISTEVLELRKVGDHPKKI